MIAFLYQRSLIIRCSPDGRKDPPEKRTGGGFLAAMAVTRDSLLLSVEERRRRRVSMPGFWTRQTGNTYDRATAMMPHLLYERLDEIGSDFAIISPTAGLRLPRIKDDETRRAVIRAYNI